MFQPFITGDATGLKMDMLTAADHTTRMAGAGTTIDADHLHMDGANAADTQAMAWDVYQMQATSNLGHELVHDMIAGTGQSFDIVMHAVNTSPTVSYDAFINNQVDIGDIHGEATVAPAGGSAHPQSQESVYAHFLYERRYDATHAATDITTIAATQATLETQRLALVAEQAALPVRIVTVLGGGTVAPPLTAAETAVATAFVTKVNTWNAARAANDAVFDARFNPAHAYGIDQENAYNRERGFDDTRPH